MLKTKNLRNRVGFTLIELLVVIGVLAVIAAGVVALIDPVDKLSQANDAKVQNDVGQLATAAQSYAAQQASGSYPVSFAQTVASGELTIAPIQPSGYNAYTIASTDSGGGACDGTGVDPCTATVITGQLKSKKYSTTGYVTWRWSSATGRICPWNGTQCQP